MAEQAKHRNDLAKGRPFGKINKRREKEMEWQTPKK
jgi:hypothetical protein